MIVVSFKRQQSYSTCTSLGCTVVVVNDVALPATKCYVQSDNVCRKSTCGKYCSPCHVSQQKLPAVVFCRSVN